MRRHRHTRRTPREDGGLERRISKPENAKDSGQTREASRSKEGVSPGAVGGSEALPTPHFQTSSLPRVVKGCISVVSNHPGFGTVAWQPWEMSPPPLASFKTKLSWQCYFTDKHPNDRLGWLRFTKTQIERRSWEGHAAAKSFSSAAWLCIPPRLLDLSVHSWLFFL